MTIHEAVFSPLRQPLLAVLFLLLTTQMVAFFIAVREKRSIRFCFGCMLHFFLSFIIFYAPMLDICWRNDHPDGTVPIPDTLSAFVSLPVVVIALYEILTALILMAALCDMLHYRKHHLTFESIKETIDLLPAGIAFARADGTVVFSNLTMNAISRVLTGKVSADLSAFRDAVCPAEAEKRVELPDGRGVWQLADETIDVDGDAYIQLIATDITEQDAITKELEEKNKKLRDIHMRLDIYNKQADRIIIAQELLTARMAVHSEVGNVLLESRHYLTDPSSFDETKLLQALKNTNNYLLREYEEDDTAQDPLTDAVETAEAIGVDVVISGPVPAGEPYRPVLAAAVKECASNAVKHANGDSLSIRIRHEGKEVVYFLQSNGDAPAETIRESGGLLSLRSLVESRGGTMKTAIRPAFTLTIRFPEDR